MKTQSQATIDITVNYCKEKAINATPSETNYNDVLTPSDKKAIVAMVYTGMVNGSIAISNKSKEKFEDNPKALKRYAASLLNDRLRKAKVLNGNTTYEAKEPGKFKNSRDPQLKALLQVSSITDDAEVQAEVQAAITCRREELRAAKVVKTAKPINYDALPADLRAKLIV